MLYGKANDRKHYEKIARHVMALSPKHKAYVGTSQTEGLSGELISYLEIKVYEDFEYIGHRFWVNPFEGPLQDCWIYRESIPKENGEWVDVWKDTVREIGEPGPMGAFGQKKPFSYRNFAKTTATFFFYPFGPLEK